MGLCYVCRGEKASPFDVSDKDLIYIAKRPQVVCQKDICKALVFALRYAFMYRDYPEKYLEVMGSYYSCAETISKLRETFDQIMKRREEMCLKHGLVFSYSQEYSDSIDFIIKDYEEKHGSKS